MKAALLLTVFALNTVVGFACSVGVDMGFNSQHHSHGGMMPSNHLHDRNEKNSPQDIKETGRHHAHKHTDDSSRHTLDSKKKDCCTDEVKQFHDLDKSLPDAKIVVHPAFVTAFIATYYQLDALTTNLVRDVKRFVQHDHPPIANIRIAIRSFQI